MRLSLNQIEKSAFYLILAVIPFQLRKVLWFQGWAFNEWLSISVYATDILLAILLLFWLGRYLKNPRPIKIEKIDYLLLAFVVLGFVSFKNAVAFEVGLFHAIKIAEFVVFYFYLKYYALSRFSLVSAAWALTISGLLQAAIGIGQFLKQGSLGLRFLDESFIGPNVSGVAVFFNTAGDKIMRAYGLTPHPNILAACLLLSILAIYSLRGQASQWLYITYAPILWAFFLTFSRTIIAVWVLFLLGSFASKSLRGQASQLRPILIWTIIVAGVFAITYWPEVQSRIFISGSDEAVQQRVEYNREALRGGLKWLGVGPGNFVAASSARQPAHNIYLLIYYENGIIGLAIFVAFIFWALLKLKWRAWPVVIFLIIGLFDHFLWTLQQGGLVFWLILGYSMDRNHHHSLPSPDMGKERRDVVRSWS